MTHACHSAQWGFHPGGWGKPPLDEYNRPLYGDVFGVLPKTNDTAVCPAEVLCSHFILTSDAGGRAGRQELLGRAGARRRYVAYPFACLIEI